MSAEIRASMLATGNEKNNAEYEAQLRGSRGSDAKPGPDGDINHKHAFVESKYKAGVFRSGACIFYIPLARARACVCVSMCLCVRVFISGRGGLLEAPYENECWVVSLLIHHSR